MPTDLQEKGYFGLPRKWRDPETALVGIGMLPFEGTVSYGTGTAQGPQAMLEASHQVELYDELLDDEPCACGVITLPPPEWDVKTSAAQAIQDSYELTKSILQRKLWPILIGGEHSLSLGVYQALAEKYPDLGVIQFDAHSDLRPEYEGDPYSHACVMYRIREHCQQVLQLGIRSMSVEEAVRIKQENLAVRTIHHLRHPDYKLSTDLQKLPRKVFLTFDIDVFDPAVIRSTGTPEPDGLLWPQVCDLLAEIFAEKIIVGLDIMELCTGDQASAFAAARLLHRMIGWKKQYYTSS